MSNCYCVYKHTSPEGKVYIGTTSQCPESRWRGGLGYADNIRFLADILDFGWRNFVHEIVESGLTAKEAYVLEAELIEASGSTDPRFGYNVSPGQPHRGDKLAPPPQLLPKGSCSVAHPIRCVETGDVYPSLSSLARLLDIDKTSLRKQIRRRQACRGYHWEYYDVE